MKDGGRAVIYGLEVLFTHKRNAKGYRSILVQEIANEKVGPLQIARLDGFAVVFFGSTSSVVED